MDFFLGFGFDAIHIKKFIEPRVSYSNRIARRDYEILQFHLHFVSVSIQFTRP